MIIRLRMFVRVLIVALVIGSVTPWAHAAKYVFVTSEETDGSIDEVGFATGIASANAICTRLAQSAGSIIPAANQAGPWFAWLSTSTSDPATTFVQATVPYLLTDGTQIAPNWLGLIDGSLDAALNLTESGNILPGPAPVYTATNVLGIKQASGQNCSNWTNTGSLAVIGQRTSTTSTWTVFNDSNA